MKKIMKQTTFSLHGNKVKRIIAAIILYGDIGIKLFKQADLLHIAAFYRCPVFDGAQGAARRLVTVLAERVSQGKIGTDDHFCTPINPNNCLTFGYKKRGDAGVIFLGDGKFYNKLVYSTNICFSLE